MDRRGARRVAEENVRVSRATAESVQRLNAAPVPTVALVQGGCFGGGTGVVAACDVVIAADNAMFSIAEVRWGLTAAIIIPQLNDAISVRQMRRYALTGERFGAEEARRIGLVHEVVPLAELEARRRSASSTSFWRTARRRSPRPRRSCFSQRWSRLDAAAFARLIESHATRSAARPKPSKASPRSPRSARRAGTAARSANNAVVIAHCGACNAPSPLAGEGHAVGGQSKNGVSGCDSRQAVTPHPTDRVQNSRWPSPGERAFTPVFDGLWGEGTFMGAAI